MTDVNGGVSKNSFPLKVSKLLQRTDRSDGIVGTPMSTSLRIIGGAAPYHATVARNGLPAGVSFDTSTLVISGTPAESGSFSLVVDVTDNNGETLRTTYFFSVSNAVTGVTINNGGNLGTITARSSIRTNCLPAAPAVSTGR